MEKKRIGIIGLDKMGFSYFEHFKNDPRWEIACIYDNNQERLAKAKEICPIIKTVSGPDSVFMDPSVEVAGIFAGADLRPEYIRKALIARKHIISENPIALKIGEEFKLLEEIERSKSMVAVNLFNRSAWYHREIREYISQGEIGALAIIRVSHQTAGTMPGEDRELVVGGPPFHISGMHYLDVARWYAGSEYERWDSIGVNLWNWNEPWWVHVHGNFKNGVVFDITHGFNYGQMARTPVNNNGIELIGTLGIIRMQHDFNEVTVNYHGINSTVEKVGPYDDQNVAVLCDVFAKSLDARENLGFPTVRDSVTASRLSWEMLGYAVNNSTTVGSREEMERIIESKRDKIRTAPVYPIFNE